MSDIIIKLTIVGVGSKVKPDWLRVTAQEAKNEIIKLRREREDLRMFCKSMSNKIDKMLS